METYFLAVVWPLVLFLLILGVVLLTYACCSVHADHGHGALVPVVCLCIAGIVHQTDLLVTQFYTSASGAAIFDFPSKTTHLGIKLVLLSIMWRSVERSRLTTGQTIRIFGFFIFSALAVTSLWSFVPSEQMVIAKMSPAAPEVFQNATMSHYLSTLWTELLLFYAPVFIIIHKLARRRNKTGGTTHKQDIFTVQQWTDCAFCPQMECFMDMAVVFLGVILLGVRPLFVLYHRCILGIVADLHANYVILPVYSAICMCGLCAAANSRRTRDSESQSECVEAVSHKTGCIIGLKS